MNFCSTEYMACSLNLIYYFLSLVSSFLSVGGKLDKYKSGLSKSNTPSPSVSPANSDHSFKPPTPPPPAGNDQLVPGSEAQ